jgi:hypothetical protein
MAPVGPRGRGVDLRLTVAGTRTTMMATVN